MTADNGAQKALDRFAVAVDTDRMSAKFFELLEDEPFSRFEEWAESITQVAEAIAATKEACEEWNNAEGREEKAEAKEMALQALDTLVNDWNASVLDLRELKDYEPRETL